MTGRPRLVRLLAVVAAWLLAVPVLLSAAAASEPEQPAKEATVQIVGLRMVPDRLEITTGTTVTWVNNEPADYPAAGGTHRIKADDGSWESPPIAPGTRWSHRFDQPGTAAYHCVEHSSGTGQVIVTGPPIAARPLEAEATISEGNPDDPKSWGFAPADLVVQTGTTVVWRNNGKNPHTVSADDKSFESGEIAPGSTWSMRFDTPGAYAYHCTPHPWMKAAVRVVEPGGEVPPPPAPPPPAERPAHPGAGSHGMPAAREGQGPVTHQVAVLEADPADPSSWTFDPPTLDVRAGDTVVWRNTGGMSHTVTADDGTFDSGPLAPGAAWSRTFGAPAFLAYHCTPHPWMKAAVRVSALEGGPPPAPPAAMATPPRSSSRARPATPVRVGSGPVRQPVDIVEPDLAKAMEWAYSPKVTDIRVGDTVVWQNRGSMQHTATADDGSFDSGMIDPGAGWSRTFDRPGVYAFHCTPHPWMKGVIRVSEAGGPPPALPEGDDLLSATPAAGSDEATAEGAGDGEATASAGPSRVSPGVIAVPTLPAAGIDKPLAVAVVLVVLGLAVFWCLPSRQEREAWRHNQ